MRKQISIINPEGIKNQAEGYAAAYSAFEVLELDNLTGCANTAGYFTTDAAVINHRMDLFYDILNIKPLYEFLKDTDEKLKNLEIELSTKAGPENTKCRIRNLRL